MLNVKDTVSDQRIEEIKKMIWEIFDTYKDGASIARQYQLFQDMKELNVEILASNNQFRIENKQLKQQLHDIKDYLSSDVDEGYLPNRMLSE
jgi:regulator of replication initiation timing